MFPRVEFGIVLLSNDITVLIFGEKRTKQIRGYTLNV